MARGQGWNGRSLRPKVMKGEGGVGFLLLLSCYYYYYGVYWKLIFYFHRYL